MYYTVTCTLLSRPIVAITAVRMQIDGQKLPELPQGFYGLQSLLGIKAWLLTIKSGQLTKKKEDFSSFGVILHLWSILFWKLLDNLTHIWRKLLIQYFSNITLALSFPLLYA